MLKIWKIVKWRKISQRKINKNCSIENNLINKINALIQIIAVKRVNKCNEGKFNVEK